MTDVKATLDAMTSPTYTYPPVAVERGVWTASQVDPAQMPFVFFFPDSNQPRPSYLPFGQIRRELLLWIGIIVDGAQVSHASELLSEMQEELMAALEVDPTRGGAAILTVQEKEMQTDEWRGKDGDDQKIRAAGLFQIKVAYYPRDGGI